jgi:formyl-CoA transferase
MQFTISSPIQVHDVDKVPAKRAPDIGEHNEEILQELGFDPKQIDSFLASRAVTEHREQTIK